MNYIDSLSKVLLRRVKRVEEIADRRLGVRRQI